MTVHTTTIKRQKRNYSFPKIFPQSYAQYKLLMKQINSILQPYQLELRFDIRSNQHKQITLSSRLAKKKAFNYEGELPSIIKQLLQKHNRLNIKEQHDDKIKVQSIEKKLMFFLFIHYILSYTTV